MSYPKCRLIWLYLGSRLPLTCLRAKGGVTRCCLLTIDIFHNPPRCIFPTITLRVPKKKSDIYQHFCKKLEKVSLRLEGQPSSGTCVAPFFNDKNYEDLDEDLEDEGDTRVDSAVWLDEEYKLTGQEMILHTPSTRRRNEYIDRTEQKDKLAGNLQPFSQFIADCPLLNEFVFQAFYGSGDSPLPQRCYLNCGDMEKFRAPISPYSEVLDT